MRGAETSAANDIPHLVCIIFSSSIYIRFGVFHAESFRIVRHFLAMISPESGGNIKAVSENPGHSAVVFVPDPYGHVTEKMRKDSADRDGHTFRDERRTGRESGSRRNGFTVAD